VAFVYCWSDHLTGKLYIGAHKGSVDDGYVCSSKSMLAEYAQRPLDFERRVLRDGLSWEYARTLERELLVELDAAKHAGFYNQTNGHVRDFDFKGSSEERRREKISKSSRGRRLSDEAKQKIGSANKINSLGNKNWLGKHRSQETKEKLRLVNLGKIHSEETKQKCREKMLAYRAKQRQECELG
jgi:hypothetical protein